MRKRMDVYSVATDTIRSLVTLQVPVRYLQIAMCHVYRARYLASNESSFTRSSAGQAIGQGHLGPIHPPGSSLACDAANVG